MANQTVYPYGTGGSLPSSIGIINDLTTGGADKALSAQQGKVIGEYIFDQLTPVDLSSLTVHDRSLGNNSTSTSRWTIEAAKHIAVPVVAGTRMRMSVASTQTTGGFYAFFTDYTVPTSNSSDVYYLPGQSRVWLNIGTIDITIPTGVTFLIICTKDGDLKSTTWTLSTIVPPEIDSKYIPTSSIVNDLTTGGVDKVLSAEQGKIIGQQLGGEIPSGLTKYEYTGDKIRIANNTHYVAKQIAATITSVSCQGGACYGNYLFLFKENNTTCWIYNLATSNLLQTYTIPSSEQGFVNNCHCNTANFGTEKYDESDPFPLIYVSTGYNDGSHSGALVYRITESNGLYALTLVQTIKIPGTEWTEFIVGDDGNCFLCYTTSRIIYRMVMPSLSDGNITFDLEDALEVYRFTPQPFQSYNQNRIYYNGNIYFPSGSGSTDSYLFVLNMETKTRTIISLYSLGITSEPETIFIWRGQLCIACRSNVNIYMLYFE